MKLAMPKRLTIALFLGFLLPAMLGAQGIYRTRRGGIPGSPNPGAYKGVAGSFHGKVKDLTKKEIMIQTDDDQTVSIYLSGKTKFLKGAAKIKPSDIDMETLVTVDASEESDLSLTAVDVIVDTPKKGDDSK
jgi:hypothetical protein